MIAFYNTRNSRFVSGYDYEERKLLHYDKAYQDHVRIFDSKSAEVVRINWNIPSYIIPVEIPVSKLRECLKEVEK